jgi:hypothetical protein
VLDFIERDNLDLDSDTEQLYLFLRITAHQGLLFTSDANYKGSTIQCPGRMGKLGDHLQTS